MPVIAKSADLEIAKTTLAPYLKRLGYDEGLLVTLDNFCAAVRNEERRKMEALLLAARDQPNPSPDLIAAVGALSGVTL